MKEVNHLARRSETTLSIVESAVILVFVNFIFLKTVLWLFHEENISFYLFHSPFEKWFRFWVFFAESLFFFVFDMIFYLVNIFSAYFLNDFYKFMSIIFLFVDFVLSVTIRMANCNQDKPCIIVVCKF